MPGGHGFAVEGVDMDFSAVSWLGVVVAGFAFFAIGGVWYGPLFADRWQRASGVTEEIARASNLPLVFISTFVMELIAALGIALVVGADATPVEGMLTGLLLNLLLVLPVLGVLSVFERKSWDLWWLNAGYNLIGFLAMGAVIGAFQ